MTKTNLPLLLALLALAGGLLSSACQRGEAETKGGTVTPSATPALPVDAQVVSPEAYRQDELLVGTLLPNRRVDIVSEVARKVVAVSFKDGVSVNKGQVLYQLDAADLHAKLKKLNAELSLAQLEEERYGELLKTQSVRQQEYDQALTRLEALQAEEELLQVELDKTTIRAPFAGKIGITKVHEGALVSPSTVLTSLEDISWVKISFTVPEKYLPLVQEGNRIGFTTDLSPERYHATIMATEPGVDANSRSLVVEARAGNPGHVFRAGLSAKVSFPTQGAGEQAITIPTEALIPSAGGYSVFLVKNGTARMHGVKVGNRTESEARITEGLQAGDTLMTSNILRAVDGTPVQVVNLKSNALTAKTEQP